jgi:hypothetical protein
MAPRDIAYYNSRLAEELAAAEASDCPEAREAHCELARFYSGMLEREHEKLLAVVSPPVPNGSS